MIKPPMIPQPIGAHNVPPPSVSGSKPPMVVRVVRIIGVNLVSQAV